MRSSSAPTLLPVDGLLPWEDTSVETFDVQARVCSQSPTFRRANSKSELGPLNGWSASTSSSTGTAHRPTSGWSTSTLETSTTHTKGLKGRFSSEELTCFRRVCTPSPELKRTINDSNWHALPLQKGKGFVKPMLESSSQSWGSGFRKAASSPKSDMLPDELMTSKILNEIYPRTPRKVGKDDEFDGNVSRISLDRSSPMSVGLSQSPDEFARSQRDDARKGQKFTRFQKDPMLTMDAVEYSNTQEAKTPENKNRSPGGPRQSQWVKPMEALTQAFSYPMTPLSAMIDFLKLIMDRHDNIDDAVKAFWGELDHPQYMTKKDLRRVLQKYNLNVSKDERDAIFKHMDLDADGHVTKYEYDLAVLAAMPVKTLMDLRRRWLIVGISSTEQVIQTIDDAGIPVFTRLSLREFGEALGLVHVTEHEEHLALFNMVLDPSDRHCRVAVCELLAAVSALSPSILLESVRIHVHKKYAGSLERAFADIDVSRKGYVDLKDFVTQAMLRFGFEEEKARKLFRLISATGSGRVSRGDFSIALSVSQSSVFVEEIRRKVLQRFRSIEVAFQKACIEETFNEGEKNAKFGLERFQEILRPIEFTDEEVARLFLLIDAAQAEELTFADFLKGTKLFAPGSAFEDLQLQCMRRHRNIFETFQDHGMPRDAPLDYQAFSDVLDELELTAGVRVDIIFDVLDLVHDGTATLGMLIAALQAGGPGTAVKMSEDEADKHARQEVRGGISGIHKLVMDVKTEVRQGEWEGDKASHLDHVSKEDAPRMGMARSGNKISTMGTLRGSPQRSREQTDTDRKQTSPARFGVQNKVKRSAGRGGSNRQALGGGSEKTDARCASGAVGIGQERSTTAKDSKDKAPPRLRTIHQKDLLSHLVHQASYPSAGPRKQSNPRDDFKQPSQSVAHDSQQSWNYVWRRLQSTSGPMEREGLEKDIQNYYQTVTWSMSHDVPLLEKAHSRYALFSSSRKHNAMLETEKQKSMQKVTGES